MKLLITLLLLSSFALADSVTVFQNNATMLVDLASSPTIGASFGGNSPSPSLLFGISVPPTTGNVLFTLTMGNQTFTVPFTWLNSSSCTPNCVEVLHFDIPRNIYKPLLGTIHLTANGQTSEFSFYLVEPVPEPGSLALLGTGLAFIPWLKSRIGGA